MSSRVDMQHLGARRVAGILAAVALVGTAAGCGKKPAADSGKPASTAAAGQGASSAAAVSVVSARRANISKTVEVTGNLVALQDVMVGAKLAGKLATVYLHEGDAVSAGQVVAVMDTADYQAQVQQAQANLAAARTKEQQAAALVSQARNQLRQAQVNVTYAERTTRTGLAVAKSQLQTAQEHLSVVKQGARAQERKQAQEQVASAKANYDKARADLQRYQRLFRQQAISQSQLDATQATFDSAQASYNSAQQALSLIQEGARPEDIRTAELAVQQARDTVSRAEADRATVDLRKEDVATARSAIASAQAGVAAAAAGTQQAQAALKLAQDSLANCYIKSPISGYVAERHGEPGQQLGAGGAVMRIVNPGTVYFEANLSESQYADVHVGQQADITVDALAGKRYVGKVTRILPVASAQARVFSVRIDFTAGKEVRPQMFARGTIVVDTHRNATIVSKDAVVFGSAVQEAGAGGATNKAWVFLATPEDKAKKTFVKVGYSDPQSIEVVSGIEPGDKVIVAGQNSLSDNDPIRVQ